MQLIRAALHAGAYMKVIKGSVDSLFVRSAGKVNVYLGKLI